MHGIIFSELNKYVLARWDEALWEQVLIKSALEGKNYLIKEKYQDKDLLALIKALEEVSQLSSTELLKDFGCFIVPDLLQLYGAVISADWKTLDLLANTEKTIHKIVRMKTPGSSPPMLTCKRKNAREVLIHYDSPRKLCALAEGIIQGVANNYDEQITISQQQCMHKGDLQCLISVTLNS